MKLEAIWRSQDEKYEEEDGIHWRLDSNEEALIAKVR